MNLENNNSELCKKQRQKNLISFLFDVSFSISHLISQAPYLFLQHLFILCNFLKFFFFLQQNINAINLKVCVTIIIKINT